MSEAETRTGEIEITPEMLAWAASSLRAIIRMMKARRSASRGYLRRWFTRRQKCPC